MTIMSSGSGYKNNSGEKCFSEDCGQKYFPEPVSHTVTRGSCNRTTEQEQEDNFDNYSYSNCNSNSTYHSNTSSNTGLSTYRRPPNVPLFHQMELIPLPNSASAKSASGAGGTSTGGQNIKSATNNTYTTTSTTSTNITNSVPSYNNYNPDVNASKSTGSTTTTSATKKPVVPSSPPPNIVQQSASTAVVPDGPPPALHPPPGVLVQPRGQTVQHNNPPNHQRGGPTHNSNPPNHQRGGPTIPFHQKAQNQTLIPLVPSCPPPKLFANAGNVPPECCTTSSTTSAAVLEPKQVSVNNSAAGNHAGAVVQAPSGGGPGVPADQVQKLQEDQHLHSQPGGLPTRAGASNSAVSAQNAAAETAAGAPPAIEQDIAAAGAVPPSSIE
ncbi:unnamed protein product, partial [Amoebophrya sp. A120]|eukprot:GSA120T00014816001.1